MTVLAVIYFSKFSVKPDRTFSEVTKNRILPSTLRVSTTTLGQFESGVKTILFRLAYGAFVTV